MICGKIGKVKYSSENKLINKIEMIDTLRGFACGYANLEDKGIILKTTDGENWVTNYEVEENDLNEIQFIDENTGWAVGENGIVIRTTNGGVTWVEKEQETIQ